MAQWSDIETSNLIEVWSEDHIQEELEGCKKNKHNNYILIIIFEKISERMKNAGFERSIEQCRVKIKKLKGEYKNNKG